MLYAYSIIFPSLPPSTSFNYFSLVFNYFIQCTEVALGTSGWFAYNFAPFLGGVVLKDHVWFDFD